MKAENGEKRGYFGTFDLVLDLELDTWGKLSGSLNKYYAITYSSFHYSIINWSSKLRPPHLEGCGQHEDESGRVDQRSLVEAGSEVRAVRVPADGRVPELGRAVHHSLRLLVLVLLCDCPSVLLCGIRYLWTNWLSWATFRILMNERSMDSGYQRKKWWASLRVFHHLTTRHKTLLINLESLTGFRKYHKVQQQ